MSDFGQESEGAQQARSNPQIREPLQQRLRQYLSSCACRRPSRVVAPIAATPQDQKSDAPSTPEANEPEERLCRYCFEGDEAGELISPCKCTGGQKYVHLSCLRMWQKAVLVSQPTHPDLQSNDSRQRICNVCKSEFTCPPPTRTELMASITGPEIAALIDEGCLIGSAEAFSNDLDAQMSGFPERVRERVVCRNWIRGMFLIVKVVQDRQRDNVVLRLGSNEELQALVEQLEEDARTLHLRGRKYTILNRGPLSAVEADASPAERRQALSSLVTPASLGLRAEATGDCGEDGIIAVNLTRTLDMAMVRSPLKQHWRAMIASAEAHVSATAEHPPPFEISHFIGGPCEEEHVAACIIIRAGRCILIQDQDCLLRAYRLANSLARGKSVPTDGRAPSGASWLSEFPLSSPRDSDEGNGKSVGASQDDEPAAKRQKQEAQSSPDITKNASPDSAAEGSRSEPVRLLVMWGYAGWSRCQLMGEIARGSWGLCKAVPEDILRQGPTSLWSSVYPRLIFAPKNEMSESYDGEVPEEEERRRQLRQMAIFHEILHGRLGLSRSAASQSARAEPNDNSSEEAGIDNIADIDDLDDETVERIRAEVDGSDDSEDLEDDDEDEEDEDENEHELEDAGEDSEGQNEASGGVEAGS